MAAPLVEFRSVVKRFDDFVAVDGVSFTIEAGEFVAIMGPSGCGKTTTLRMLAGLEAPSKGDVLMDGRVMNDVPAHERDTPLVWQSLALFPFLTARENVEFGLQMRGVAASQCRRRALEWLDRMEIAEFAERDIASLSGGQKQRVALARALAPRPKVLLLDEPLSALDLKLRKEMQLELKRLQHETGITFIFVTHDQEEALTMSDRVAVMRDGEIHQIGSPQDIYNRPSNRFVADFIGESNFLEVQLLSRTGSIAKVRFANGAELDATLPSADVTVGSITVIVRPEHARLTADKSAGHLQGVVNDAVYFGTDTHYYLTLDSGEEFVVRQQNQRGGGGKISSGAQVGITINEDSIQALAN